MLDMLAAAALPFLGRAADDVTEAREGAGCGGEAAWVTRCRLDRRVAEGGSGPVSSGGLGAVDFLRFLGAFSFAGVETAGGAACSREAAAAAAAEEEEPV